MNIDERIMRYVMPSAVFVLAVFVGLYVDKDIANRVDMGSLGLPYSLPANVLLALPALLALGFVLFSVTYAVIWLVSRFVCIVLWVCDRHWAAGFIDAWSFWPEDLRRAIEDRYGHGSHDPGKEFAFHWHSEYCGFFLEKQMPEWVRTKLARYWFYFYTNWNSALSLLLAWLVVVKRLGLRPVVAHLPTCDMSYGYMLALFGVLFVALGFFALCRAWALEWFFVRRMESLQERPATTDCE